MELPELKNYNDGNFYVPSTKKTQREAGPTCPSKRTITALPETAQLSIETAFPIAFQLILNFKF
jgi:hypothetical protein